MARGRGRWIGLVGGGYHGRKGWNKRFVNRKFRRQSAALARQHGLDRGTRPR